MLAAYGLHLPGYAHFGPKHKISANLKALRALGTRRSAAPEPCRIVPQSDTQASSPTRNASPPRVGMEVNIDLDGRGWGNGRRAWVRRRVTSPNKFCGSCTNRKMRGDRASTAAGNGAARCCVRLCRQLRAGFSAKGVGLVPPAPLSIRGVRWGRGARRRCARIRRWQRPVSLRTRRTSS